MQHRLLAIVAICFLGVSATARGAATTVRMVGGKEHSGAIALVPGKSAITVETGDAKKTEQISLLDVERLDFAAKDSPSTPGKHDWEVTLRGGGQLRGKITAWQENVLTIAVTTGDVSTSFAVPTSEVGSVGPVATDGKTQAATQANETDDVVQAYVGEGNERSIQSVAGQVVGIEEGSLLFSFREERRKIDLSRVTRIELRTPPDAGKLSTMSLIHELHFGAGNSIRGAWECLNPNLLCWRTTWGAEAAIPLPAVRSVHILNGRYVSLTEVMPISAEQTPYFTRVMPYRINTAFDSSPLKLSTGAVDRGLCLHSRSVLRYDIGGQFARFTATCGLQSPQAKEGDAIVRVRGDGKLLFENPRLRGSDAPVTIDLSVAHVKQLTLEVDFGEGQDVNDWVVWANPRLQRVDDGK